MGDAEKMENEQPVFELHTFVSEAQYRRGLRATFEPMTLLPRFLLVAGLIGYCLWAVISFLLGRYPAPAFLMVIISFCLVVNLHSLYRILTFPKRAVQQNIDGMVMSTGSGDIDSVILFFEDKIKINHKNIAEPRYLLYKDINKVIELSDLLIFEKTNSFALYISKADVADMEGFLKLMYSKCPSARLVKKNT